MSKQKERYLFRYQFAVIENGKTKKMVWLETEAASEKEAWDKIGDLKAQKGLTAAEFSGHFEINGLNEAK